MEHRSGQSALHQNITGASNVAFNKPVVKPATFFPTVIPYPCVITDHFLCQAATGIVKLLMVTLNWIKPVLQAGDSTQNSILQIAKVLDTIPKALPSASVDAAVALRMLPQLNENKSATFPRVLTNQTDIPSLRGKYNNIAIESLCTLKNKSWKFFFNSHTTIFVVVK